VSKLFVLDSGVFINSWVKHYPSDVFPAVWDHFHSLCERRQVCIPEAVKGEIEVGKDELWEWLKKRKRAVMRTSQDVIDQMSELVNRYPGLVAEGGQRSAADPWVISCALVKKGILVTEENPSGKIARPKIPDVCFELGLESIKTVELLRRTGFCARGSVSAYP
jgi:hypothetical protein